MARFEVNHKGQFSFFVFAQHVQVKMDLQENI